MTAIEYAFIAVFILMCVWIGKDFRQLRRPQTRRSSPTYLRRMK